MSDSNNTENKTKNSYRENVHEGHRERMRKRFLKTGLMGFDDHQMVELLLFYAIPRHDTNVMAHRLLRRFGSIDKLIEADCEELERAGLTENAAVLLKLIPKLSAVYYISKRTDGKCYVCSKDLQELFLPLFAGIPEEQLKMACFDCDRSLVDIIAVSRGTRNRTDINMRKIVEEVIRRKCPYVALAHNHPRGPAIASADDLRTTERVRRFLFEIGVELLDHIIVGRSGAYSMAENTVLPHDCDLSACGYIPR